MSVERYSARAASFNKGQDHIPRFTAGVGTSSCVSRVRRMCFPLLGMNATPEIAAAPGLPHG